MPPPPLLKVHKIDIPLVNETTKIVVLNDKIPDILWLGVMSSCLQTRRFYNTKFKCECAGVSGNRYPPYPQPGIPISSNLLTMWLCLWRIPMTIQSYRNIIPTNLYQIWKHIIYLWKFAFFGMTQFRTQAQTWPMTWPVIVKTTQLGVVLLQMCVSNLRTIHPVIALIQYIQRGTGDIGMKPFFYYANRGDINWYYKLSIYCGYIWYDSAHSTPIAMIKLRSDLHPPTNNTQYIGELWASSVIIRRNITIIYRERAVLCTLVCSCVVSGHCLGICHNVYVSIEIGVFINVWYLIMKFSIL